MILLKNWAFSRKCSHFWLHFIVLQIFIIKLFLSMKNIKRIIREEINKLLINENIANLTRYATYFENCARQIGGMQTNALNRNINKFLRDYIIYLLQLKFAIQRCVQANNLNEAYYSNFRLPNLRDIGLNLPPELGGNFINDFRNGYYGVKNILTNNGRYGSYGKRGVNGSYTNGTNQNMVRKIPLSTLLNRYQRYENYYARVNRSYGIGQIVQSQCRGRNVIEESLTEIRSLIQEYTALKNAQGTNP